MPDKLYIQPLTLVPSPQAVAGDATRSIRVCIVMGSHWSVRIGGSQYQAKCLVEALANKGGFEIFYLARRAPATRESSHEVIEFGPPHRHRRIPMLADLPSLYRRLASIGPDVVYQRGLKAYTGLCAFYCRRSRARRGGGRC